MTKVSRKQNRRPMRAAVRRAIESKASALRRAGTDLLFLAGVLDVVDLAELLLVQSAVLALHNLDQILVHDDVAGRGIDRDRAAWAVVFPGLQRVERGGGVGDLALGG